MPRQGLKVLRGWVVPKYGGRPRQDRQFVRGGSVSEHKEGPLANCPTTLRHRDHVHISLNRNGGSGRTSFYAGRLPAR